MPRRPVTLGLALVLAVVTACTPATGGDRDAPVASPASPPARPAAAGCYDEVTPIAPPTPRAVVRCADRHLAETYHVGGPAAGEPAERAAVADCTRHADAFLGGPWRTGPFTVQPVLPSAEARTAGARWHRCDLVQIDLLHGTAVVRTDSLRGALTGAAPLRLRCFDAVMTAEDRLESLTPAPCDRPHDAEFAGPWDAPADLAHDRIFDDPRTASGCRGAIAGFLGLPDDDELADRVGWLGLALGRAEWDLGLRTLQCLFWADDGPVTGSYRDAGPDQFPVGD
ncbi:septum formation family protein [Jidongwangia harbinensis]|uniref:septum formation family protein n=1 Tax=Jidongwangia harbinensis TaxID=2878561 RepID=UPI001CDA3B0F|nr:septum formation family protein [Jidongwangia harbinensis]MCA2217528.1 septum formation family protein [Jidongwangia harbinensis]